MRMGLVPGNGHFLPKMEVEGQGDIIMKAGFTKMNNDDIIAPE